MTTVVILVIAFQNKGAFSEGHSEYNKRFSNVTQKSCDSVLTNATTNKHVT